MIMRVCARGERRMTLEQLRIFVEVAARQHITRAAAALNMTQSAVSSAITNLESRHNIKLFDRVGRAIVLNQTGRIFLSEAQAVLSQARAAKAVLNDLAGLMRGELSVAASQTVGAHWLPPRIAAYHKAYPGITLDVQIGNTEEAANAVEAGHAEIAIVEGMVDRKALSSEIIATDEMVIVVARDHPWASMRGADIALESTPWVLRETGWGTRLAFDSLTEKHEVAQSGLDIALILPTNEAVLAAVEAGIGATLVSRSAASAALRGGLLTKIDWPAQSRPLYLLRHRERYRSKAAIAFEDLAADFDPAVGANRGQHR